MSKLLVILAFASCALALVVSPASAATRSCPTSRTTDMNARDLTATNMTCKRARTVMREHLVSGRRSVDGFRCRMNQYEGGTTHICRNDDKRFKFSTAD